MIEIRHRETGAVLRTVDAETLEGADLTEATLSNGEAFERFVQVTVPRLLLRDERPDAAAVAAWPSARWQHSSSRSSTVACSRARR